MKTHQTILQCDWSLNAAAELMNSNWKRKLIAESRSLKNSGFLCFRNIFLDSSEDIKAPVFFLSHFFHVQSPLSSSPHQSRSCCSHGHDSWPSRSKQCNGWQQSTPQLKGPEWRTILCLISVRLLRFRLSFNCPRHFYLQSVYFFFWSFVFSLK